MAVDQEELEVVTDEVIDEVKPLEGEDTEVKTDEEEELQVQIGEESPPQDEVKEAPEWVKELRKSHRELVRENRELKAKQLAPKADDAPKALEKPKLEQFDYDEAKFEQAMDAYYAAKGEESRKAAEVEAQRRKEQESVEQTRQSYLNEAKALKVKDFQESEEEVISTFSTEQQGFLLRGAAAKPALVVYALGKDPKKLQELASIKDPVKFIRAVVLLEEKEMKVTTRKTGEKPMPETTVKSSSSGATNNAALDRLRAEAAKTGDMTKVHAFKRQMRKA